MREVLIGGRAARDPETYLALYGAFPWVAEPSFTARGTPVAIAFRSVTLSPWTDGHNRVAYYPTFASCSGMVSGLGLRAT